MRISNEAALMLLALALYLFDSLLLLSSEEAALLRGWRGRWFAGFGASRWRLASKEPYVPNPFTPHFPLFRLRWRFVSPVQPVTAAQLLSVPKELSGLGPFVQTSAVCLFLLLPIGLFLPVGTAFTMTVVGVLYLNNLVALTLVFRSRKTLCLARRQFASIAFECLACPPFSINLVRKLCAKMAVAEDFIAAASRLMRPEDIVVLNAQCLLRLDEQIDCEDEGSPRMQALLSARSRFVEPEPQ